jgi:hypothetical protein
MRKSLERHSSRATLQQVAILANVSATTVSLVLAGKAGNRRISEDTHRRVKKAAEDLNYAPNLLTRSLRRGRTHIFSFFSTFRNREEHDMYMNSMVSAVESAGGQAGYDVLVHCNFKRSPKEIYQFLNGGIAEGLLLFAPRPEDPLLPLLRNSSLPIVIINGRDPEGTYPSVSDDVDRGMKLIAEELIRHGHQEIAVLVADEPITFDAAIRINLLKSHLAPHGVTISDHRIIRAGTDADGLLTRLCEEPNPPSALFCWHDRLAYRILAAAERIGLQIPEEMSIIGYDGIHWPSKTSHVAASVRVDLNSLARRAVQILDQYLTNPPEILVEDTEPVFFVNGTTLGSRRASSAIHLQRSNDK